MHGTQACGPAGGRAMQTPQHSAVGRQKVCSLCCEEFSLPPLNVVRQLGPKQEPEE